jgi:hypothetical protein
MCPGVIAPVDASLPALKNLAEIRNEAHRRAYECDDRAAGLWGPHKRARARWAPIVATGRVACGRCGHLIGRGEPWDLGHDDLNRSRYKGPEHVACNRATAGRSPLRVERTSRRW